MMTVDGRKRTLLSESDYERARACVNGCAGINPEAISDMLKSAMLAEQILETASDALEKAGDEDVRGLVRSVRIEILNAISKAGNQGRK